MRARPKRQIIAVGGAALPAELDNLKIVQYFLEQTRKKRPKVCFIGTAGGDAEGGRLRFYAAFSQFHCRPTHLPLFARTPRDLGAFLFAQDAIFVGGGNTRSMLAVWRDWELDCILRLAWERGIVLSGSSAGAICWFEQGPHRLDRRPAYRAPGPRFSPGKLLPALRQRARAPSGFSEARRAGRDHARRRGRRRRRSALCRRAALECTSHPLE